MYKMCIDRSSHYSPWRFTLNVEKVGGFIGGTVCTKCVLIVPCTTVNGDLPLMLKKLVVLSEERCVQNVY